MVRKDLNEFYYRSKNAIVRWARSRAYRHRRRFASYLRAWIEEVLGVKGIRIDVRTAEKVMRALKGARVRIPQLARQIAQRDPRLRKKWLHQLRRAYERGIALEYLEKAERELMLAEAYKRSAQNPEELIAAAIRAAKGWAWEDYKTLSCVLQQFSLPSALASLYIDGRLCLPGRVMSRILRILQQREPGLPIFLVYWKDECVAPTPEVYVYPGKPVPKLRKRGCLHAVGDRWWQPRMRDLKPEILYDVATSDIACIYVRADYAWRESDCSLWSAW